jgi:hypothetical protein
MSFLKQDFSFLKPEFARRSSPFRQSPTPVHRRPAAKSAGGLELISRRLHLCRQKLILLPCLTDH